MRDHHQRAIRRIAERFADDPRFLAVVVGGSVAKGLARDDSDIDVVLIATDEEYARRQAQEDYSYFDPELCDYPGGYMDGKVVDLRFMQDVADHGSEPARAAFVSAFPACSRLAGLEPLLARIVAYPEQERDEKVEAFYSQVQVQRWYMGEADKWENPYLRAHVAAELVLFGGRLILAYNRILYPYHKWFMTELKRAPDKPEDLICLAEALLAAPSVKTAEAFAECISNYRDWGVPLRRCFVRFIQDSEWNWREGRPPIQDW